MTAEKRIEEIRARHFDMLADLDLIDEDDWDDMSAGELPLLDPRAVEPDLAFLLAALDAERARAVRTEAAMSDVADFLAWEENKWIATGDSVPDAVRKVVLGLRAERDARPAISPEDAREFLRLMVQHDFDMRLRYSDTAVRVGEAINSHAAKAGGGT